MGGHKFEVYFHIDKGWGYRNDWGSDIGHTLNCNVIYLKYHVINSFENGQIAIFTWV